MEGGMARRGYQPEFRRRVVELVEAGRKVAEVAADLGISEQTVYTWRRQARIDAGLEVGLSTSEKEELAAAKRRIRELETELAIHRRATELLKEKASWVQEGTKVANPYLGPMMQGCGQKVGGAD
jgi:transposase-like protein